MAAECSGLYFMFLAPPLSEVSGSAIADVKKMYMAFFLYIYIFLNLGVNMDCILGYRRRLDTRQAEFVSYCIYSTHPRSKLDTIKQNISPLSIHT